MNFNSKKTSLIILGITSLLISRLMFAFFDDPEGPNLLVVFGMAAILYVLSLAKYLFNSKTIGREKLLLTICIQIIIATVFYFFLK